MANLIEVIFESVSKSCVMQLLSRLIGGWENVVNIECTESLTLFNESQLGEGGLKQFMDFDGEATALINISSINLERVILRNVQLRLIKYDEQYDIEFNFNSDELGNTTTKALIKELHAHATRIAFECEVSNFYCGMEPASDEDTRYFTNGELGPLAAQERFIENPFDVARYCCCNHDELRRLADRGFSFKLFQENSVTGRHVDLFAEVVNQVIEKRKRKVKQDCKGKIVAGRILTFDPSLTMYDGVSEEATKGFFDSDDVPPPEFWLGILGERLASFIPSAFIGRASEGVESCLGGCLEWATDEFEIILQNSYLTHDRASRIPVEPAVSY